MDRYAIPKEMRPSAMSFNGMVGSFSLCGNIFVYFLVGMLVGPLRRRRGEWKVEVDTARDVALGQRHR